MNLPEIFLFIILFLVLWVVFYSQRASIEFAKAKKHTAWSNMGLYFVMFLCVIAFLSVQFRLNAVKIGYKDGVVSGKLTSSEIDPFTYSDSSGSNEQKPTEEKKSEQPKSNELAKGLSKIVQNLLKEFTPEEKDSS